MLFPATTLLVKMCLERSAETLILEFVAKLDTDQPLSKAFDHTFGEF